MRTPALLIAAALVSTATLADPATPANHPERDFKPIGGGIYVSYSDPADASDGQGNRKVRIYSRELLSAGSRSVFNTLRLEGIRDEYNEGDTFDGGTLGTLHHYTITLDCAKRTVEVVRGREAVWRPAARLPALAPVFKYACTHTRS
jgi:hypothetical protein